MHIGGGDGEEEGGGKYWGNVFYLTGSGDVIRVQEFTSCFLKEFDPFRSLTMAEKK